MATASAQASSSTSNSTTPCNYEVFLSFMGDDTRDTFCALLHEALRQKDIFTFIDERLSKEGTFQELVPAIEGSLISVVIISQTYASSIWCLSQLEMIIDSIKVLGRTVLPIFYGVDPSDIRHQRGSVAQAFEKHDKRFRLRREIVQKWRYALTKVANICGWNSKDESEELLVVKVAEDILNKRISTNLNISIYPLRYDTLHRYLGLFLQVGLDDVLMVGLCGGTGMGKTAIAQAVFDQISFTFEGSSFLADVGRNSRLPNGLVHLQEKLLSDTLLERNVKVANVTRGMDLIKEKLCFKRVLIVLDNVDDLEQLYALIGSRSWFGKGSKIIITTRSLHLLNVLEVDQVFLAEGLPLPSNIQIIWKQFQRSHRIIAGLQHYIHLLHQKTMERERHLQQRLQEERQKNVIQAQVIAQLKQAQAGSLIKDN